ncbi:MAG: LacI family DNA-binding transcriptional regulator [Rectinemataceae bacterium]|jgi:alanine racemase
MRPTIKDIALRAGVSKTTVSFALNDPGRISEDTYNRVMAVVAELDYVPNPVARTLTTKRLGALGLLLPQPIAEALRNPYLWELICGIGRACEERELSLTLLPPIKGKIIEAVHRSFVDALLTIGIGPDDEVVGILRRRRIPFVTIDGTAADATVNVGIDDVDAAHGLMRHVLGLGHRALAVFALRPETLNLPGKPFSLVSERRLEGFARALGESGLRLDSPGIEVVPVECSLEGGAAAAYELLARAGEAPTAILAMADAVALGVYAACDRLGMAIPGEISVAGFDDIPMAAVATPHLTTVHQPGREKGAAAAALVIDLLEGREAPHRRLEASLVIRASTAPPRASGQLRRGWRMAFQ